MQASTSVWRRALLAASSVASRSASPERSIASATQRQEVSHSAAARPFATQARWHCRQEGAVVRLRREPARGGRAPRGARSGSADARDRSAGCAGRRSRPRAHGADVARHRFGEVSRARTPRARATPRPRKTTPAHGRSGRQSSVLGNASPSPSHREPGRIEQRRVDEATAPRSPPARPRGSPTPAPQRTAPPRRLATAMQCRMPKKMPSPGAKTRLAGSHQRRGARDDREPPPERGQVEPVAMGERQRYADQRQKGARHAVRQEPHRGRERQDRRETR